MKSALTRAIERKEKVKRNVLNGHAACGASPSRDHHHCGSLHDREEAMSYLDTPEHKVGLAAYQLRQTMGDAPEIRDSRLGD